MELTEQQLNDLTDNIELVYKKLKRIEVFLNGITVGLGVLLASMVVILVWLIL